jgi:hypothetical protein
LLRATQSVPRACIVYLKLASASASAQRRSRGVEHVFDLTGWARKAKNGKKQAKATTPPIWSAGAHIPVGFCGEYGACVGLAAFFERNCDEIIKLTELTTTGLTRSPDEKQNGKKAGKKTTRKLRKAEIRPPLGFRASPL